MPLLLSSLGQARDGRSFLIPSFICLSSGQGLQFKQGGIIMKRLLPIFLCISFLLGCSGGKEMDQALAMRAAIEQAESCSFRAKITADYGDHVYQFTMDCVSDRQGNVSFTVAKPEVIAGITGKLSADGGKLTFDDAVLAIPMLTDDQITPVSAPWILLRTLRGGYITSSAKGRVTIDDSYADDALTLDITMSPENLPVMADIYWKNRRILTVELISFVLS